MWQPNAGHFFRRIRRVIVISFLLGCAGAVILAPVCVGSFLLYPFGAFDGHDEFIDLSGRRAKSRLTSWPSNVETSAVQMVSHQQDSSRDSYSSWYQIKLSPDAAAIWQEYVHIQQEESSKSVSSAHKSVERVHRTLNGRPPMHWQTGQTPTWWHPLPGDFRATEAMLWYANCDSGVGRATYSYYDESTNTLWIYQYACQHDRLWAPGCVPEGTHFGTPSRKAKTKSD